MKLYYSIGEVAEALGVKPHVLRYWESEGAISPARRGGRRVYTPKHLLEAKRLKALLDEGHTLRGAARKLKAGVDGGGGRDALAGSLADGLRQAIEELRAIRESTR